MQYQWGPPLGQVQNSCGNEGGCRDAWSHDGDYGYLLPLCAVRADHQRADVQEGEWETVTRKKNINGIMKNEASTTGLTMIECKAKVINADDSKNEANRNRFALIAPQIGDETEDEEKCINMAGSDFPELRVDCDMAKVKPRM